MSEQADLTEAKPAMDSEGNIWMGAAGGVMTFNAIRMGKSDYRPDILFTGIRFQGEQQERPVMNRHTLHVADKEQRNLTIAFAALDYGDNYLMQYAYRMKESDNGWNYIGCDPHIAFSQLSPGRHTLIVRSTNCDGVWTDNDTDIVIEVEPMLWERTGVRLLVLLLVIGLTTWAAMAGLNRRRKMLEREKRMERILQQYQTAEEHPTPRYTLSEPQIVNEDEVMMNRLMAFIEEHIADETLKIEDMSEAVGLSRTVFYEKIRETVGQSPSDFLRQVRMQRARQLMEKSRMNVSQIAFAVGFSDPKYFTKCFKKLTGFTPSDYRANASSSSCPTP
jgi:AraC-like DNA-binding protein